MVSIPAAQKYWFWFLVFVLMLAHAIWGLRYGVILGAGLHDREAFARRSERPGYFWYSLAVWGTLGLVGVVGVILIVFFGF